MRVVRDGRNDKATIYLTDFGDRDVARTETLASGLIRGEFSFMFDKRGVLLGIEVDFASSGLPRDLLDEAETL